MIYLISDNSYLKIGYAKDPKKRLRSIQTGNISAELLRYKAGSLKDEKKLHEICKQWHVKREWFQNVPEVIQAFDDYDPFSNEELQVLKEEIRRIEKEYNSMGEFTLKYNSCWNDIEQKLLERTSIPEEWKSWIESYKTAILYNKLVKTLKGSTTEDLHTIKFIYRINNTIIGFPFDLYKKFSESVQEELNEIQNQINIIKELKTDLDLVKSSISKELIHYQIQNKKRDLDNKSFVSKFHINVIEKIDSIFDIWINEFGKQNIESE